MSFAQRPRNQRGWILSLLGLLVVITLLLPIGVSNVVTNIKHRQAPLAGEAPRVHGSACSGTVSQNEAEGIALERAAFLGFSSATVVSSEEKTLGEIEVDEEMDLFGDVGDCYWWVVMDGALVQEIGSRPWPTANPTPVPITYHTLRVAVNADTEWVEVESYLGDADPTFTPQPSSTPGNTPTPRSTPTLLPTPTP